MKFLTHSFPFIIKFILRNINEIMGWCILSQIILCLMKFIYIYAYCSYISIFSSIWRNMNAFDENIPITHGFTILSWSVAKWNVEEKMFLSISFHIYLWISISILESEGIITPKIVWKWKIALLSWCSAGVSALLFFLRTMAICMLLSHWHLLVFVQNAQMYIPSSLGTHRHHSIYLNVSITSLAILSLSLFLFLAPSCYLLNEEDW